MKKLLFLVVGFVLCLSLLSGQQASASVNSTKNYTEEQIKAVEKQMRKDGSSEKDIKSVIKKLKNNEKLDSEKPKNIFSEKLNNPKIANEISEKGIFLTDESPEKTVRYPDGSYIKVKMEVIEEEEVDLNQDVQTLSGGNLNQEVSTLSTGFFLTVKATGTGVFGTCSYYAKIWIDTHLGNDYISSIYNKYIHTQLGSASEIEFKILRQYEIRSQDISAKSYLQYLHTTFTGTSSKTHTLKVHAGDHINDRYGIWVDYNDGSESYKVM